MLLYLGHVELGDLFARIVIIIITNHSVDLTLPTNIIMVLQCKILNTLNYTSDDLENNLHTQSIVHVLNFILFLCHWIYLD